MPGPTLIPSIRPVYVIPALIAFALIFFSVYFQEQKSCPGAWVSDGPFQAEGLQPSDLILTEGPERALFCLGWVDFHVYARGDFERLVEEPHRGRTLWVIGSPRNLEDQFKELDNDIWPAPKRAAERKVLTDDGWMLLSVKLPAHYRDK